MLSIAIALGGGLGALARHFVNHLIQQRAVAAPFSYGIFVVNVTGCLAIGLFAGALAGGRIQASPEVRSFIVVGLLGGYTTFSSFSLDTLVLIQGGQPVAAFINAFGQLALGILAVWAGFAVAR
jgi:CrcB protein